MRTDDHPAVNGEASASGLAHRFTAALAARDAAALRSLFGSEVDFRALTPGRGWEVRTPETVVHGVILGSCFESGDVIQQIESVQRGPRRHPHPDRVPAAGGEPGRDLHRRAAGVL